MTENVGSPRVWWNKVNLEVGKNLKYSLIGMRPSWNDMGLDVRKNTKVSHQTERVCLPRGLDAIRLAKVQPRPRQGCKDKVQRFYGTLSDN